MSIGNESQWTLDTLKEYFLELRKADNVSIDERFQASKDAVSSALVSSEKAVDKAFLSQKEAVNKAEGAQNQYNVGHNDLLRKMEDMLPRKEADSRDRGLEEKILDHGKAIAALTTRLDVIAGKSTGVNQFIGWIAAAIAVAAFFIEHLNK